MKLRISILAVMALIATTVCWGNTSGAAATGSAAEASAVAQQSSGGGPPSQPEVIAMQLSRSLDSKKLNPGDSVEAKVMTEFHMADGTIVPRGSKVMGHVTASSARSKGDADSSLGVAFDQIVLRDGRSLPLKANLQAVAPPPNMGPSPMQMGNPGSMPSPGAPVGAPGPMGGQPGPGGMGSPQANFPVPGTQGPQTPGTPGSSTQDNTQNKGELPPQTTGVVGFHDLELDPDSTLRSRGKQVKLEAGSQLLLRVQSQ
jgi:hypothetical protein